MRIVLVNHCHPDTPHVCATRMREFAHALTGLGHWVLLVTETLRPDDPGLSPETFRTRIAEHDFTTPLTLAFPPRSHRALCRLRTGDLNWLSRKIVVLNGYLRHDGVFTDWREAAIPYIPIIADQFVPDITLGSFGNTDCWNIARDIAGHAGCPWVADIKDYWRQFIPGGLRDRMARHFNDAAAVTAFSFSHIDEVAPWFRMPKHAVFSGFDEEILNREIAGSKESAEEEFKISLTGAIYDERALNRLISGIEQWIESPGPADRRDISLLYAGNEKAVVHRATERLNGKCRVELLGFINLENLHQLHRDCRVNMYVNSDNCFHHKVLELLAAGRPVLCYPAEMEEAVQLAASTGGTLHSCATPKAVADSFRVIETAPDELADRNRLRAYAWNAQATKLTNILQDVITGASR